MTDTTNRPALFDVLAIHLETGKVHFMAQEKEEDEAEAIVKMAVMRRRVDVECFGTAPAGRYKEGDAWKG